MAMTTPWRLGYYWSPTYATYSPSMIPWAGYTHISQVGIRPTAQGGIDDTSYSASSVQSDLINRAHAQGVKVLAMLFQDDGATAMVNATAPSNIDAFVSTLVSYIDAHGYDGIDLDWENGVVIAQYVSLITKLRAAKPTIILSIALPIQYRTEISAVQSSLDRITVMGYDLDLSDYNGVAMTKTWHNSALLAVGDWSNHQSVEGHIDYLLWSGISASKIILGMPFYGYVNQGCISGQTSPGCANGVKSPDQTFEAGKLHRSQIQYNNLLSSIYWSGTKNWDSTRKAPYISYTGARGTCASTFPCDADAFVSYSDAQQMGEAVSLANTKNLGGVMTFAFHQEYISSASGEARYPLTKALNTAMGVSSIVPASATPQTPCLRPFSLFQVLQA